ncbi:hypothetical protein ActroDRAFT_0158 [Actinospica robiniae DSM 44927]|uniref:Uncharacterized protein n=1 Tax=Actinospica robiniae DSM 44927 TaxID=479430 RepID=W9E4K3_9ACTN|nr:hypothetical protein ActroDRAFT_0158 [Actinospica robiniae DSM 44927]
MRGCALFSVGPRRQSGTCREVKRRRFPLVADSAGRRLTSRQNPDRASPARPRREPTPWGIGASCARAESHPAARPQGEHPRCGRILHRRFGSLVPSLLLQRRKARSSARKSPVFLLIRRKLDSRLLSVAASSMEEYGGSDLRREGWWTGWLRGRRQGCGRKQCRISPRGVRPGHAILRSARAPGGSDRGDAESFRIGRGPARGVLPRGLGSGRTHQRGAGFHFRCDRSTDAFARIEDRDRRIRVMQNPSAPGAAGPRAGLQPSAARTAP